MFLEKKISVASVTFIRNVVFCLNKLKPTFFIEICKRLNFLQPHVVGFVF